MNVVVYVTDISPFSLYPQKGRTERRGRENKWGRGGKELLLVVVVVVVHGVSDLFVHGRINNRINSQAEVYKRKKGVTK